MKEDINEKIEVPQGVQASLEGNMVVIKGPKGEVKRKLSHPSVKISTENNTIHFETKKATKREKALLYTFTSHVENMIKGVQIPFIYKLKICAGPPRSHFPAQVTVKDSTLSIKNFLGEKVPRELKIRNGTKVEIKGDEIIVESVDIESAGRTASEIELLMKTKSKDRRIFQDGIYIIERP